MTGNFAREIRADPPGSRSTFLDKTTSQLFQSRFPFGGNSKWTLSIPIRFKVFGVAGLMLLILTIMAGIVNWLSQEVAQIEARERLAMAVLRRATDVSDLAHDFYVNLHFLSTHPQAAGRPEIVKEVDTIIAAIETTLAELVPAIEAEINATRESPGVETKELEILNRLSATLNGIISDYRANGAHVPGASNPDIPAHMNFGGTEWKEVHDLMHELVSGEFGEIDETALGVQEQVDKFGIIVFVAGTAAIATAGIAIVLLAGSIRRAFVDVTTGIAAFATENFEHRIPVRGRDEFADLAITVNAMASELSRRRVALQASADELQIAVHERTRELQEANVSLERVSAARKGFLADMSHELRTPLTVIRGEADVTLRNADASPSEYERALRVIVDQARHMGGLVDDLLFVAASEAGRPPIRHDAVDIVHIVRDAIKGLETTCAGRDLLLSASYGVKQAVVHGDARHLKRLTLILIENAILYSMRGRRIDVSIQGTGSEIEIRIEDQGIGIAPEELSLVFDRHFRGMKAREQNPSGSGLGLPMAKAIAEAHGGSIVLEGKPGIGTTAIVRLPIATADTEVA